MSQRARISSKNTKKIELSDGSHVIVVASMSWRALQMAKAFDKGDDESEIDLVDQIKASLSFLKESIVGWNFIDGDGKLIDFDKELIDDFDMETITEVFLAIKSIYTAEKKSSQLSEPTSSKDSEETEPSGS